MERRRAATVGCARALEHGVECGHEVGEGLARRRARRHDDVTPPVRELGRIGLVCPGGRDSCAGPRITERRIQPGGPADGRAGACLDVLDVEQPSEALGKTAGKDAAQQKITFPAVYGIDRSREMAEQERIHGHLALNIFDGRAERLRQIADWIVRRSA